MDQPGQDLFNVTSTSPLQRNKNSDIESLLIGIPGSPFPGENNNGVKSEKHRDGQTLTGDHAGHNKTAASKGTERASCLQNATQVVLEQQSGESWRMAENEGQKRLCPGKLAKERAGREDSAEREPCGETSGFTSATGRGGVESASAMSGSGGGVDNARATSGGGVDSASATGGGAGGVQSGSATGGGGSGGDSASATSGIEGGVDSANATGGGGVESGTKGAPRTAAATSTNGIWPSSAGVGRAPGGVCGRRVGAGAGGDAERESPGRRSGSPGDAVRVEAESPSASELQPQSRGLASSGQTDGSSCSFGSSLCFSAPLSGDDGEPAAVQRVVKSQRQINNSAVDEQEDLPAAHWSLEPLGGDCPEARGEPPDLVIEVAGRRIRAHQAVLAARSDYFRARRGRRQLALRGLSLAALRPLLDYAYGGDLGLLAAPSGGLAEAAEVLAAARLLQMPGAAQRCAEALEARLELCNCLALLGLAQRQRLAGLRRAAYRFMSDHYLAVLREPAVYGRLSGVERELILRRREAEAGGGERCLVLADLNDVYERPLGGGSSRPESRESSRPQSPELGCSPTADSERWLYRHDANSTDDQWKPLSRLPEAAARSRGCGLCALHNYLFVAGGLRGGGGEQAGASDRVFAYNAATGGWAEVRPMRQARSQLKLVALDGLLYAVGGECLLSVERYDPRADRWSPVAPLPRGAFAVAHQAVACSGRIYVSGGSLFHRLLCYDPRRDEWVECPGSRGGGSRARSRAGGGGGGGGGGGRWAYLVARGHCLYRFELDRGQRALSVCRYNTVARLWSECTALQPPQPQLLLPFRCALLGRAIYCVNRGCTLRFMLAEDEQAAAAADGGPGAFDSLPLQPCAEAKGLLFPIVLTLPEKPHKKP